MIRDEDYIYFDAGHDTFFDSSQTQEGIYLRNSLTATFQTAGIGNRRQSKDNRPGDGIKNYHAKITSDELLAFWFAELCSKRIIHRNLKGITKFLKLEDISVTIYDPKTGSVSTQPITDKHFTHLIGPAMVNEQARGVVHARMGKWLAQYVSNKMFDYYEHRKKTLPAKHKTAEEDTETRLIRKHKVISGYSYSIDKTRTRKYSTYDIPEEVMFNYSPLGHLCHKARMALNKTQKELAALYEAQDDRKYTITQSIISAQERGKSLPPREYFEWLMKTAGMWDDRSVPGAASMHVSEVYRIYSAQYRNTASAKEQRLLTKLEATKSFGEFLTALIFAKGDGRESKALTDVRKAPSCGRIVGGIAHNLGISKQDRLIILAWAEDLVLPQLPGFSAKESLLRIACHQGLLSYLCPNPLIAATAAKILKANIDKWHAEFQSTPGKILRAERYRQDLLITSFPQAGRTTVTSTESGIFFPNINYDYVRTLKLSDKQKQDYFFYSLDPNNITQDRRRNYQKLADLITTPEYDGRRFTAAKYAFHVLQTSPGYTPAIWESFLASSKGFQEFKASLDMSKYRNSYRETAIPEAIFSELSSTLARLIRLQGAGFDAPRLLSGIAEDAWNFFKDLYIERPDFIDPTFTPITGPHTANLHARKNQQLMGAALSPQNPQKIA